MDRPIKLIASNKNAYHEYFIEDTFEAGIVLNGCEVKSVRAGGINLKESYVRIKNNAVILVNAHISPYAQGSYNNSLDPKRDRMLLLNRSEIRKLKVKVEQKGYTIVATKVYFSASLVKIEIALAKGKELHDKRDTMLDRDAAREMERARKTAMKN